MQSMHRLTKTHAEPTHAGTQGGRSTALALGLTDSRPSATAQRELMAALAHSPHAQGQGAWLATIHRSPAMVAQAKALSSATGWPAAALQAKYGAKAKEMKNTADALGLDVDDIKEVDEFVNAKDNAMWRAFTSSTEAVKLCLSLTFSADELIGWMNSEKSDDHLECAKSLTTYRKSMLKAKAPAKEVKVVTKNTISAVEKYWVKQGHEVATSKSGGGMLLLKGLSFDVDGKSVTAHISLPPNADTSFSEGHLKIEGGSKLNQYFFSVDGSGKLAKMDNSPTVATQNPGQWQQLPAEVWTQVKNQVEHLASGEL